MLILNKANSIKLMQSLIIYPKLLSIYNYENFEANKIFLNKIKYHY